MEELSDASVTPVPLVRMGNGENPKLVELLEYKLKTELAYELGTEMALKAELEYELGTEMALKTELVLGINDN
jgi:hypothetical protein